MLHNKSQRTVNLNSMLLVKYTHRVIRRPPRPHSLFNTIAHYDNDNHNNNHYNYYNNNNNNNNKANIYTG